MKIVKFSFLILVLAVSACASVPSAAPVQQNTLTYNSIRSVNRDGIKEACGVVKTGEVYTLTPCALPYAGLAGATITAQYN